MAPAIFPEFACFDLKNGTMEVEGPSGDARTYVACGDSRQVRNRAGEQQADGCPIAAIQRLAADKAEGVARRGWPPEDCAAEVASKLATLGLPP